MPISKKTSKRIGIALVLAAAAAAFVKWQFFPAKPPGSFISAPAATGDLEDTVLASGTLQAFKQVSVGAQVSGQIQSLKVALGDNVKQGQLIAEIDSMTQQNTVRNAEAALATARANLRARQASLSQVEQAYKRQQQLRAADAGPQSELESAEATYRATLAEIDALQAQMRQAEIAADTAKVNLGYTRIVAPMDGQVVAVVTQEGQTVNANQAAPTIIKLAKVDSMTVKAQISEADVVRVQPGQKVYFTILGEPEQRYAATLRAVEPAPDSILTETTAASTAASSATATAVYYNGLFDVPNPDGKLRISMTAQVYIVRAEAKGVVTIPSAALGERHADGSTTLRVLDAAGNAQPRQVRVGLNNNVTAEIREGLAAGEQVVLGDAAAAPAARRGGMPGGPPPR
ncbi:efflux RND transporter periplasmic adaptor subunit [Comamonas antarctica]|uniref:efflux RND transporter periplasmic adaptor subunit n=1 Tax=Comamonas antarctica TaxID=2743470 RepID=UPI0028E34FD7|nr:efflux RND transporter periplasmic adaptor subunit [Comamonas antarctica]